VRHRRQHQFGDSRHVRFPDAGSRQPVPGPRCAAALVITRVPVIDDVVGAGGYGEHRPVFRREAQLPGEDCRVPRYRLHVRIAVVTAVRFGITSAEVRRRCRSDLLATAEQANSTRPCHLHESILAGPPNGYPPSRQDAAGGCGPPAATDAERHRIGEQYGIRVVRD